MNEPSAINLSMALHERDAARLAVSLQMTLHGERALATLVADASVSLNQNTLRARTLDVEEYGRALAEMLFADQALRLGWAQARAYAAGLSLPLRLRLQVPDSLQWVAWETMLDPLDGLPVALHEQLWLTRDLASASLHAVPAPSITSLRAIVAVAAPSDLASFRLAPIDALREVAAARVALSQVEQAVLARAVMNQPVTLQSIAASLRHGPQLLYLVAHGSLVSGEAYLWLENEAGSAAPTAVAELAAMINGLGTPPLLAILMSCNSAGADGVGALKALGPHLVRGGVPTVIAMQGNISAEVAARFTPALLKELCHDGVVDRALSMARLAVSSTPDWWMPVLYSRVPDNRLWRQAEHAGPRLPATSPQKAPRPGQSGQHLSLRKLLLQCNEFQSQRELRALFGADALRLWQARLPEADSLTSRVDLTLDYLYDRKTSAGRTGIALLLEELLQRYEPDDERYALLQGALEILP
jgi:hypothetical protein